MDLKVFLLISFAISVYIILGGLLFQYLEKKTDNELNGLPNVIADQIVKDNIRSCLDLEELESLLRSLLSQTISSSNWTLNLTISDNKTLTASVKYSKKDAWDLYGSIFYAETLVTTIGYGSIAPVTVVGRLISCIYAIIGIPMVGLWAAAIGENIIKTATKLRKRASIKKKWHRHLLIVEVIVIGLVGIGIFIFAPAQLFAVMENWSFAEGIYFSVITLTTVGFGDFVAGASDDAPGWYRAFLHLWLLFGLGWLSMIVSLLVTIFRTRATIVVKQAEEKVAKITTEIKQKLVAKRAVIQRRNSFAGKRQVSVMLAKTSTALQIFDVQTGLVRMISQSDDVGDVKTDQLNVRLDQMSSNIVVVSDGTPRSPRNQSRRSSIGGSYTDIHQAAIMHHQLHLPTIDETAVGSERRGSTAGRPSWVLGSELVVETSKHRPSLGHQSSVLLFNRCQRQTHDEIVNRSVLEQLVSESNTSQLVGNDIVINIIAPVEDTSDDLPPVAEEESVSDMEYINFSKPSTPRLSLSRTPVSSASRQPSSVNLTAANNPASLEETQHPNNRKNGDNNLVVMTDNGIAESLATELTILRPRSRSCERF